MRRLLEAVFFAELGAPEARARHDAFVADLGGPVAVTTDAFVVTPLFFPGGDIGSLAVNGTVNDLAMAGAAPRLLAAAFVLEEGLAIDDLRRIVRSMADAARAAEVRVVTGDTKVVDRGHGHGVYVTTTGVGVLHPLARVAPSEIRAGDAVLVNGDLGRHGIAVLSVREGLAFEGAPPSDCAPLWLPVKALLDGGVTVHCLRDLTRGGLGAALCELAADAVLDVALDEAACPVSEAVAGACELFGLDPLFVANEGRFVAFVPEAEAQRAAALVEGCGGAPRVVGRVVRAGGDARGRVEATTRLGGTRLVELPSGEQLPRIC